MNIYRKFLGKVEGLESHMPPWKILFVIISVAVLLTVSLLVHFKVPNVKEIEKDCFDSISTIPINADNQKCDHSKHVMMIDGKSSTSVFMKCVCDK